MTTMLWKTVYDLQEMTRDLSGRELLDLAEVVERRLRDLNIEPEHTDCYASRELEVAVHEAEWFKGELRGLTDEASLILPEVEALAKRLGEGHEEYAGVNYIASRLRRIDFVK